MTCDCNAHIAHTHFQPPSVTMCACHPPIGVAHIMSQGVLPIEVGSVQHG
jgi:hypothetical protein